MTITSESVPAYTNEYHVLWMGNRWIVRTDKGRVIGFASSHGSAVGIATRAVAHDNANGGRSNICLQDETGAFSVMH